MHGLELVQDLAVVMATAAVATILCQRLRQPVVLGYILAGIFIGPEFGTVSRPDLVAAARAGFRGV